MMRVHTQLNYKRKLQVDQTVVKTGSTVQAKENPPTYWAIYLEFSCNQLHAMLSLWAN